MITELSKGLKIMISRQQVIVFLRQRRPTRSTQSRSSAASDVYSRQMFRNALQVMAVAQSVGAVIVIEWPRACRYWHHDRVKRAIQKFGLQIYDFDGCMYGIKSILPGTLGAPIRKPWRIATNCPIIGNAFSVKCDGSHSHTPCEGGDTKQTENYSRRLADRFHRAFKESCEKREL